MRKLVMYAGANRFGQLHESEGEGGVYDICNYEAGRWEFNIIYMQRIYTSAQAGDVHWRQQVWAAS